MKAAVLYEYTKPMPVVELTQEAPKAGEVRVRMGAAGICASDLHVIHGAAPLPLPMVLGHEGAGTVEEVGEGVNSLKPGDRCVLSFVPSCGHCRMCRTGRQQLCEAHARTGSLLYDGTTRLRDPQGADVQQMGKLGVFGESIVTPAEACYPVPDEVPMEVAALIGCCVTTGVGAVIHQPGIEAGSTVAVFGVGGVGLNVVQGAKLINASRIFAVDIQEHKLSFAKRFGATDTVNASEQDPVEAIRELTGGGVDYAFDAFGGDVTIGQAFASLRRGGTAVMIGLAPFGDTTPIDMVDLVRNEKRLVGCYYGSGSPHETFGKMVELYERGQIDVDGLVTRRYKLEQINEAFEALDAGGDGRGVIVF